MGAIGVGQDQKTPHSMYTLVFIIGAKIKLLMLKSSCIIVLSILYVGRAKVVFLLLNNHHLALSFRDCLLCPICNIRALLGRLNDMPIRYVTLAFFYSCHV